MAVQTERPCGGGQGSPAGHHGGPLRVQDPRLIRRRTCSRRHRPSARNEARVVGLQLRRRFLTWASIARFERFDLVAADASSSCPRVNTRPGCAHHRRQQLETRSTLDRPRACRRSPAGGDVKGDSAARMTSPRPGPIVAPEHGTNAGDELPRLNGSSDSRRRRARARPACRSLRRGR